MEPVYILQHDPLHGAGYFQDVMSRHDIPTRVFQVGPYRAAPPPKTKLSGLALFGGPFDVHHAGNNWMKPEIEFVKRVIDAGVPVLGHGFGGELVATALRCSVVRNSVKQIGWFTVESIRTEASASWLDGVPDSFEMFKWHMQAFETPANAVPLFHSDWTPTEAFALGDVLAFLGHFELTRQMLTKWLDVYDEEVAHPKVDPRRYENLTLNWDAIVEGPETMFSNLNERLALLHRVADAVYGRWAERLLAGNAMTI